MIFGISKNPRDEFNNSDFSFQRFEFDIESFKEYLKITNSSIDEKLKSYIKEYEVIDDYEIASSLYDNEEMYIKTNTLQLYYSSIIISLYSFLEQTMLELCSITEKKKNLKIEDISGKGIFKFKTYLEKVINIDFEPVNTEWKEICQYNHLRNLFVHNSNSFMKKSTSKRRINSIKEIKGLTFIDNTNNNILIEFENDITIRNFIRTINSFISKIYFE
ncbi:hypothetical protein [Tenacibaculum ovolyticum]|uniref:hypothetical protein n=1 Tax=Tenacibaculum ovolyticum TaxID=104270 RepID=UPI0003F97C96|nr:hypothetical protein [Tenacibaculum ovolyticum]